MLRVRQIKISVASDTKERLISTLAGKLKVEPDDILSLDIIKKSVDARDKTNIYYSYEVITSIRNEKNIRLNDDILRYTPSFYHPPYKGKKILNSRPIIVGSGPAGLFCAYILAVNGYKPIILERGNPIEKRTQDVEEFWQTGKLNPNSNVQFGEGGAGTFSDGKLNTLIKDPEALGKKVFEIFVKYGAPKEIMYLNKPHIGTDLLRDIIINMRNDIIKMGGEFKFATTFTGFKEENNSLTDIFINKREVMPAEVLVLALGHSSRDTFAILNEKLQMEAKSFAVGVRVSHKQKMINESQYGSFAKYLPPADYKLTYTSPEGRGVYSFCMCPGGFVVNASSEEKALVINGMSNHDRGEENANSAIIVSVSPDDFGHNPLDGVKFQASLERRCYEIGMGKIPTQKLEDFYQDRKTTYLGKIKPVYKGDITLANLNEILPSFISKPLKEALLYFGTKIKGFDSPDALISAIESRSSSPVRILRDEKYESNIKGIYPCGEGAGYAGGITSSAIDGIKVAHAIIEKYYM